MTSTTHQDLPPGPQPLRVGDLVRSAAGLALTAWWCSLALLLRPFWAGSVAELQTWWARSVLAVIGVQVRVHLHTPLAAPPCVYAANHQSGLDILVLIACMPDSVRFVAKKEMAYAPFTGWCMRVADYIFVDRGNSDAARASLQDAGRNLNHGGRSVVIFPEGHRYPPGTLGPFKTGAVRLALEANVPLVPVGITGTGLLMERRTVLCRPGTVDLHVGAPMDLAGWEGREREARDVLRGLVKDLAGQSARVDVAETALQVRPVR